MRILRLTADNFRTLQNLDLQFPYYYSAICGRNDSGKTNIVRAIRGVVAEQDPYGYIEEDEITFKSDLTKWHSQEEDKRSIKLSMTLEADRNADAGLYEFLVDYLDIDEPDEILSFCVETILSESEPSRNVNVRIGEKTYSDVKAQQVLKKIQSSRLILFHNSTEPDPRLRYGRPFREIAEQHTDEINKLNASMNRAFRRIAKEHQQEITALIGRLDQKYKVELTLPDISFSHLPFDISIKDSKVDIPLDNWGSGTRNRTLILLTLFKAKQIAESTESASKVTPIIVIEEPESFLHPAAQAEFSRVLQDLAEELKVQVIATTHSPYMLSKDSPDANVLLERQFIKGQRMGTERVDTTGEHWMEPFGLALGVNNQEFSSWRDLLFSKADKIVLVEGRSDKEYLELIRSDEHGDKKLKFDGEIYPYEGIGNIKNGVLLNFLKNKYKRILITFDLDVVSEIENVLKGLGFENGKTYASVGINKPGKRNIEGLIPEKIKNAVYTENSALVDQGMNGTRKEKDEAKKILKTLILKKFKENADVESGDYAGFYSLAKTVDKCMKD